MGKTFYAIANLIATGPRRPAILRYALAVLLPLVALGLTLLVTDFERAPFFPIFNLAILLASMYGGTRAGLASVAVSVLLNVLAVPPVLSLSVSPDGAPVRMLVFVAVGCAVSVLIGVIAETQHKLEYERERLSVTLSSIGDGVIVTDVQARVTFLNRVAEEALGWTQQEVMGKPLKSVFRIVNETTRAAVENPVERVLAYGTIQGLANHTLLVRRDGSEIPIDDSAAPIRDTTGQVVGVVLVFRDITVRKETESALLRQEKLATVGRLASTIAHEINNPLASVTNLLYLVERSPGLPPELRQYVEMAQGELSRAAHVARQSLSFYRPLQSNGLVAVEPVVVETLKLYKGRLDAKNIATSWRIDSAAYAVTTASNLRQVLANLISNAVDAMPAGGRFELRVAAINQGNRRFTRITVADNGHGIRPEARARLFEPFFTTKTNTGTGLGLWLSRQIVESDGGRIRLRSTPGVGTVFQILIPGEAAQSATGTEPSQA